MGVLYVKIDGITCDNCRARIKENLLSLKEVKDVEIVRNIAKITLRKRKDEGSIIQKINSLGYFTRKDDISENIKDIYSKIDFKEFVLILLLLLFLFFFMWKVFGYNIFNVIPTIGDNVGYGMLFMIGVFTSVHCISMCGAINLMTTFHRENRVNLKRSILYNLGRLISYTLLGGVVGLIGSVIQVSEILSGSIILLASVVMLFMALGMLNMIPVRFPRWIHWNRKVRMSNSFVVGLLNGFMTCGPLQAMQLYALSTASFIGGALSMFLFCLGTIPLMFGVGVVFNVVKGRKRIVLSKIASVLILLLSIVMLFRGLSTLGINYNVLFNDYGDYTASTIRKDYQEVRINLSYDGYDDVIVQKGMKVRLVIHVSKKYLTGCNNVVWINEFNIKKELKVGDNVIEFTPDKVGVYSIHCWMNMITNRIKVIDDERYFEVKG